MSNIVHLIMYLITAEIGYDQEISDTNKNRTAILVSYAVNPILSFILSMHRLMYHNLKLSLNLWPPENESTPSTVCCMELKHHLTNIMIPRRYVIS